MPDSPSPRTRSRHARHAATIKAAFSPDAMVAARDGKRRLFLAAIAEVDPTLDDQELERRADRLSRAWHEQLSYERWRKHRGEPFKVLNLDAWLRERVSAAKKKAAPPANGTAQEMRDATAPAPTRS